MKLNSPMRWLVMVFLAFLAGCGGCQTGSSTCDSSRHGTQGCECRTSSASCNAGLACNSGKCEPCGGEGAVCCVNAAVTSCNGSLMCVMGSNGERCRNCGDVGEACCVSSGNQVCNPGGVCVSGNCQSVAALTCDDTGALYAVGIQDANLCAVRVVEVRARSAADALDCATSSGMLSPGERVFEVPGTPITDYEMCVETEGEGRRTTSVRAFGDFEAMRCTRWTRCGDVGCTSVAYGACTP
ncbi:hypothetical protein [Corallococcus macrosporus]|uniref:Lipoprotein n=1 Tax=Corallococcus macrosporus DSM 14697 TaxID=1189310 RepID=A0A250JMC5_9BACT|nr:hypothetical protein [Corallococcus macrosporus]ATB45024.1 hypothetical protein MYMAC_000607 [Corallococcus macrosporus DSM 14697]